MKLLKEEIKQLLNEEDGEKSGPFRVWKKGEAYPGIAMSRSIGDFIASKLGVIPEPKFIEEKMWRRRIYLLLLLRMEFGMSLKKMKY